MIVPDVGYDGLVIQMGIAALDLYEDGRARVGAGVPWETVVDSAVSRGWAGVECLTGIPGLEVFSSRPLSGPDISAYLTLPADWCGTRKDSSL